MYGAGQWLQSRPCSLHPRASSSQGPPGDRTPGGDVNVFHSDRQLCRLEGACECHTVSWVRGRDPLRTQRRTVEGSSTVLSVGDRSVHDY